LLTRSAERAAYCKARASRLEALLLVSRQRETDTALEHAELASRVQALDATIRLAYPRVRPDVAGCVRPWAGRYGEHGALTDFVRQVIREAAPEPMSVAQVKRLAVIVFQLDLRTPGERRSLKWSIKTALRRLRSREGVVVAESQGPKLTLWRWKVSPTLDDLKALGQVAHGVTEPPHDPPEPHTL
jgi:hypothetical protein